MAGPKIHEEIRGLWSLTSGDPWGDCMSMWFAIAEVMWAEDLDIPEHWEFQASPLHERGSGILQMVHDPDVPWPDSELARLLHGQFINAADLVHAGNVFTRCAQLLKAAGRDY